MRRSSIARPTHALFYVSNALAGPAKARKQGRVGGRPRLVRRRDQVAALRAKGLSISGISEKMEIPRTSVHRILKELAA
ncbi:MAG: hypothetical protein ABSG41_27375 [Bryobacteraceae bacterium]